eukprot:scaffold17145_cov109-Isochrysis_galbana.AAC.4
MLGVSRQRLSQLSGSSPRLPCRSGTWHGESTLGHREEADAKAPEVDLRALVPFASHHLRRCVARRAARGAQLHVWPVKHGGQAKVNHLDLTALVDQDVLGLDVAVRHAHRVARVHTKDDLPTHRGAGVLFEGSGDRGWARTWPEKERERGERA